MFFGRPNFFVGYALPSSSNACLLHFRSGEVLVFQELFIVLLGFAWVCLGFPGVCLVLLGFSLVVLGFARFCLGFPWWCLFFLGFCLVFLGFSLGFPGFCLLFLGFAWCSFVRPPGGPKFRQGPACTPQFFWFPLVFLSVSCFPLGFLFDKLTLR